MDTWPIAPSPTEPEPESAPERPGDDALSPVDLGGAIDLPPSPSEQRAAAALMRAAYALSATMSDKAPQAPRQPKPITVENRLPASGLLV
ncbi:hypothetical protein FBZ89_102383 [Nitrospirillum amazonense]|uniref:Uncharacterized protein n=1 Tax=Nitrospirillum amazonense TaxID=28077 RepID=A0A560FPS3_9PROT|nr:hypothetical protein [Nitrospirillum amazonense]TWB23626.1 hypothetical protein FBZ89_102383 [Nitrospirillum amazonense]